MVSIRRASDEDNQALLDVEKMCPQGTGLVLLFDRRPDFFLRSKAYDNYRVYVAEEGAKIVGTVSTTTKEFNVNGRRTKSDLPRAIRMSAPLCVKSAIRK